MGKFLSKGEILSCDRFPVGSNYTFLVKIGNGTGRHRFAIYKPKYGEVPLWDFPSGTLYKREYAAYLLSVILGWNFIPETVIRGGPYGVGSVQRYVIPSQTISYGDIPENYRCALREIACFDILANNADRKAMHCFIGSEGRVWGIDHGLTFHQHHKLRTAIWDFWGEEFPVYFSKPLTKLMTGLNKPRGKIKELVDLLEPIEIEALKIRLNWLVELNAFPTLR
ncbi:SCO1664 family protein [SAR202 cluster bacterium AC-409-J13_OGT_754m]|nr:SCO1664 family protein [SAR202 cluster bacterium AC-409-J13_OGT_754m]